jgi:hypothetical protein
MATFNQKKVWHSHLKQKSPIVLRWKGVPRDADGTPRKSDYGDYYQAFFEVRNDDEDGYYYVCEDESILETILAVPEDVWTIVTAAGGKDSQVLDIKTDDGSVVNASVGETPQSKGGTPRQSKRGAYTSGALIVDYTACFDAAQEFVDERLSGEDSIERFNLIKELGTTLYIQWSKGGFSQPIYPEAVPEPPAETVTVEPTLEAVAETPAQTGKVEGIKAKLEMLPKKNGTSHDGKQLKRVTDAMAEQLDADPTNEQLAKMEFWLDAEVKAQTADNLEFVPDDDLPF